MTDEPRRFIELEDPNNATIQNLMDMQKALFDLHKDTWEPLTPEYGRNTMLYIVDELGECIAILKKKGEDQVMNHPEVRAHFLEEMSDVLMYYIDLALNFGITSEELTQAFTKKHRYNMTRDWDAQNANLYTGPTE